MGSPVWTWESLESTTYTMRAVVLVLLGLVAINAEAEANHHVYNSVVHHGYGHVAGVHPVHPVYNHHAVPAVHHYNHFMYGKREAEAEADPSWSTTLVLAMWLMFLLSIMWLESMLIPITTITSCTASVRLRLNLRPTLY